eukprot:8029767-Pyramimonas_sp.AAC.1
MLLLGVPAHPLTQRPRGGQERHESRHHILCACDRENPHSEEVPTTCMPVGARFVTAGTDGPVHPKARRFDSG